MTVSESVDKSPADNGGHVHHIQNILKKSVSAQAEFESSTSKDEDGLNKSDEIGAGKENMEKEH